jgi:hypothetical protein
MTPNKYKPRHGSTYNVPCKIHKGPRGAYPIPKRPEGFSAKMFYRKGRPETVQVIADSFPNAIAEALEERTRTSVPERIDIQDPSLGEVFSFIKKATVKTGQAMLKVGGHTFKYTQSKWNESSLKKLIRNCYSSDESVRLVARQKLKMQYPDVYDKCSFSEPSFKPPPPLPPPTNPST